MKAWILALVGLMAAAALQGAAQSYGFEPLRSNGAIFYQGEERLPLRCLDALGLLAMDDKAQEAALDRAAAAGFNSVSFEAPLFGETGFCRKLGALNTERAQALGRLVDKMALRRLYAFPVLWNSAAVQAFEAIGGGPEKFFAGKAQNQWQAWLLRETVKASGLSTTAAIGGWILYRGPWPGPKHREQGELEPSGTAQAFTQAQRSWILWQLRALRQAKASQLAGFGYYLKDDLAEKNSQDNQDPALAPASGAPPLSEKSNKEVLLPDAKAMDSLPPLPGMEKNSSGASSAQGLTPWDLEGVDWDSVGRAMQEVPVSTGLDFMELTLDTEDWYRIGEAMGGMAQSKMQTPLLWRQDWRTASRYERQKHLDAPQGIAGLAGPWPEADWPETGESIWPVQERSSAAAKPLLFKYLEIQHDDDGGPALTLHLNRPAEIELSWGKAWPLSKHAASNDAALVHLLPLKGAKFGQNILFVARASSSKWGSAVLKCRWVNLKQPAPAPPSARSHRAKKG